MVTELVGTKLFSYEENGIQRTLFAIHSMNSVNLNLMNILDATGCW